MVTFCVRGTALSWCVAEQSSVAVSHFSCWEVNGFAEAHWFDCGGPRSGRACNLMNGFMMLKLGLQQWLFDL
jgi:hypothetical protein